MNILLILVFGAVVLGLWPQLEQRRLSSLIFGFSVLVALVYFLSSRGR